ncbi:MAG: tetratricopeptide repeat protein [Campylobacteraceae bacterium]
MRKIFVSLLFLTTLLFSYAFEEKQELTKSCDDGNANSCLIMAKLSERNSLLQQSKNTPESREFYKKAASFYAKGCSNNESASYVDDCVNLANLYLTGNGVSQSFSTAKKLFDDACEKDNQNACIGLGSMYLAGSGVRQDDAKSRTYFENACVKEDANGCFLLAMMYDTGKGAKKNKKQALEYYGKACDYNLEVGCVEYKRLKNN